MANSKQEEFFDCAIVIRQNESDEICLKFQCKSIDAAIEKLDDNRISGQVISFMFGDFHTVKK